MPGHYFFLSYARQDREGDPYGVIDRFYRDLARAVRQRTGLPEAEVGFLDTTDVQVGDPWPGAIEEALRTCRAFVPILSPGYLTRLYCGKEWTAFRNRLPAEGASLIQPVLLVSRSYLTKGPQEVTDIADSDDALPELYRTNGLEVLVRQREDRAYEQLITAFATRLIEVIEAHPLAPTASIPPLEEIPSAFHGDTGPGVDLPLAGEDEGPRIVQFMLVAARRNELATVRAVLEGYSNQGPIAWRPWHPENPAHVSRIVTEVAVQEGFIPTWVDAVDSGAQQIKDALERGNVVVVIADVWTLRLDWYYRCMQKVDESGLMNCAVVVLWNERDDETVTAAAKLRDAIRLAFANRSAFRNPTNFLDDVSSPDDLRRRLAIVLANAGARVTEYIADRQRAQRQHVVIAKPELAISIGEGP